jgi:hypothetical protein
MRKVLAHKGCEHRGENPRGVYAYTKLYASANPEITSSGEIIWETGAPWEGPLYAYELVCFDCDTTILAFTDEIETYKLSYAAAHYPDDYNVEVIEVSD